MLYSTSLLFTDEVASRLAEKMAAIDVEDIKESAMHKPLLPLVVLVWAYNVCFVNTEQPLHCEWHTDKLTLIENILIQSLLTWGMTNTGLILFAGDWSTSYGMAHTFFNPKLSTQLICNVDAHNSVHQK